MINCQHALFENSLRLRVGIKCPENKCDVLCMLREVGGGGGVIL